LLAPLHQFRSIPTYNFQSPIFPNHSTCTNKDQTPMQLHAIVNGVPQRVDGWSGNLNLKISQRLDLHDDLTSLYICNPSLLRQLSPSTSSSLVEHKRFGGLDEISPIGDHRHLGWCTIDSLPQNRGYLFHLYVWWIGRGPPNLQSELFISLASSFLPSSGLQSSPQTNAYLFW
jgi:hypothetical protein